jgi:hypothetical protein
MNVRPAPIAIAVASLLSACASAPSQPDAARATQGMVQRQDLEIVDCLLPGQVRQLGGASYLTQRRPIRTTTSECRIRGGEYVSYDRADLRSSLRIWMAAAEAGDPEAQTTVGEIYERGLGTEPNYEAAIVWYRKAADQGNSRALFNLGTLYEQGLGVPADKLEALNLYRRAWGLPEDSVMFQSAARREQEEVRRQLEAQIQEKDSQLQLLQKQLAELEREVARRPGPEAQARTQGEIATLKKLIATLQAEQRVSAERLADVPRLRTPSATTNAQAAASATATERKAGGLNYGRYYALVIGNQHYRSMEALETPLSDASRAAKVLESRYGFTVQILEDANDVTMLKALNDLNAVLKPEDNLLIYYAGHGTRLSNGSMESGYWLPVNADPPPLDTFWLPNEQVTGHLGRLSAKRILVIADSCYAGLLSSDPSYLFIDEKAGYTSDYIAHKLTKRSRLLMSSGGNQPVLDTGGGANSVFANALLAELESNDKVLSAPELFTRIRKRVEVAAAQNKLVQKPEFKTIKGAGHEVGDFFFVPKG